MKRAILFVIAWLLSWVAFAQLTPLVGIVGSGQPGGGEPPAIVNAYDLRYATVNTTSLSAPSTVEEQIYWADDKLWFSQSTLVTEYTLPGNQDSKISDAVSSGKTATVSQYRTGLQFSDNGAWTVSTNFSPPPDRDGAIFSTPFDLNTISANVNVETDFYPNEIRGAYWRDTGDEMFIIDNDLNKIHKLTLASIWHGASTLTADSLDIGAEASTNLPAGLLFSPDGVYLYFLNRGSDSISQWKMSTPWNPSTATLDFVLDIDAYSTTPYDIAWFGNDYEKMLYLDTASDLVYQLEMNTAPATGVNISQNTTFDDASNITLQTGWSV